MGSFIANGGPFMYLILLIGAAVVLLAAWRGRRSFAGQPVRPAQINTVLYLGATALLLGVIAQLTGLYSAATAILEATAIAPSVVAEGILISFNTTLLGFYILVIAVLLWLFLRAIAHRHGGQAQV
jgi:hypothetical protein